MNLETILSNLASTLDNVSGITVSARPPTVVQVPQAFVTDILVVPNSFFEGGYDITVEVTYLLGLQDADATWSKASQLMSSVTTASIYGVLTANPTLSGAADSVRLETEAGFRMDVEYQGVPYFGFRANVNILAT